MSDKNYDTTPKKMRPAPFSRHRSNSGGLSTLISGGSEGSGAKMSSNSKVWKSFFWVITFTTINLVAAFVNHIDDTDEVYGYWEPLHYLLFNQGMQTWEYAPQYAIRSYAFVFPFYAILKAYQRVISSILPFGLPINTIPMFYIVRLWLSLFTGLAQASFVMAVDEHVGKSINNKYIGFWTGLFMATSPGVFFASTSFLPSAVAMSAYMLTIAAWLKKSYLVAIGWGVVAVVWSGWPFVGLLFLPIGLHMLYTVACNNGLQMNNQFFASLTKVFLPLIYFIVKAILVVILVAVPAFIVDVYYYDKPTLPALNILLYNALGGNGDELYGIEPPSYYLKNLFLNTGLAWPLTLFSLQILLLRYLSGSKLKIKSFQSHLSPQLWILHIAALVWLIVLFSRPHKEERFLYPVYPLLAVIAACAFDTIAHLPLLLITSNKELMRERSNSFTELLTPSKPTIETSESETEKKTDVTTEVKNEDKKAESTNADDKEETTKVNQEGKGITDKKTKKKEEVKTNAKETTKELTTPAKSPTQTALSTATVVAANSTIVGSVRFIVFVLVITTTQIAIALFLSRVSANYMNYRGYLKLWKSAYPKLEEHLVSAAAHGTVNNPVEVTVCMGREWYRFPSHFFLPKIGENATVVIRLEYIDDGFKGILPQHYPTDYLGTSLPTLQPVNNVNQEEHSRYINIDDCDYLISKSTDLPQVLAHNHLCLADDIISLTDTDKECSIWKSNVALVESTQVISTEYNGPAWLRAFYVPIITDKHMKKSTYGLFSLQN